VARQCFQYQKRGLHLNHYLFKRKQFGRAGIALKSRIKNVSGGGVKVCEASASRLRSVKKVCEASASRLRSVKKGL
jgi:hypothetical protein